MGKNSAGREARRARQEEDAREARVKEGSADIRELFDLRFNDAYYKDALAKQKAAYADDFGSQWEQARLSLETALRRNGLWNSTEGKYRVDESLVDKGRREQDYNQRALAAVDSRRQSVTAAEDNVLSQLRASGDRDAAVSAGVRQMNAQNQPIPYSPLGSVFTDFTAGLATQADQERQGTNRYNLGVTNWGNNLRRYTQNIGGR